MSAGPFELSAYESSELEAIMPVKIQEETLLLFIAGVANSAPTAPVNLELYAHVSKNRNEYGVGCRSVTIKWEGEPPEGYKPGETLRIPVLTSAAYLAYKPGRTGNYLGSQVKVLSRSPENAR